MRTSQYERNAFTRAFFLVVAAGACEAPDVSAPRAFSNSLQFGHVAGSEWSEPENVAAVNSAFVEQQPVLSPDGLALYFSSGRPGGIGGNDLWVSRRPKPDGPWGPPSNLGSVINSVASDGAPSFSHDGHLLFFHSDRPGGQGLVDIYLSRRSNVKDDADWGPPINLGPDVNTAAYEAGPIYLQNVEEGPVNFYFSRGPDANARDIYAAAIRRDGTTLGAAYPVAELNSVTPGIANGRPFVRQDGKEIVFHSTRPGGFGLEDLYVSTRRRITEPWSVPSNLGASVNSSARDWQPFLSLDGQTLLFVSNRPGTLGFLDIYISTSTRHRN